MAKFTFLIKVLSVLWVSKLAIRILLLLYVYDWFIFEKEITMLAKNTRVLVFLSTFTRDSSYSIKGRDDA